MTFPTQNPTAVLDFTDDRGAPGRLWFENPSEVFIAQRPDEVRPALSGVERAASEGRYAVGFVAYEAAPGLDPDLVVRERDPDDPFAALPLVWFGLFSRAEETSLPVPRDDGPTTADESWVPTTSRADHERAIRRIRELIAAGETYQVNHTIRLRSRLEGDPRGLYRDLCYAQRGAFAGYLDLGRYRVLSASPELFVERTDGKVVTRPMKGTAPRGRWPEEDRAVADALLASAKDRAENAMIVDLLRNDLGRISRPGSVAWNDVFQVERFETVWQLTTTVSGDLVPGVGASELFRALFPSGSVTGAPKVRTMRIIRELEDSPRGVYCGSVGYLAPPGAGRPDARFNVAIRTVVVDTATRTAEYGVGGGITWDSRSTDEYDELVAKARVLTARRPGFELFETMRYDGNGDVANLDRHLERLAASAGYFGFRYDDTDAREAVEKTAASAPASPCRVRLTLGRSGSVEATCTRFHPSAEPVRVAIDDVPQDPRDVFLFHKTTRRARYDEARRRHPDADDVLLVNDRGEVTESTIANLAVKLDGTWWTPPLDAGLLPGVGRTIALEEGRVRERPVTIAEARSCQALALVSDVRGWRRAALD
jgi:para-aminobenzoate synthetase/4-amino-4-deoxychorismate lyase